MSLQAIKDLIPTLTHQERKELLNLLVDTFVETPDSRPRAGKKRSLRDLRGLGKEIWQGVDAQEYIDQQPRRMGSPFVKVSAALAGVNRLYIEAAPLVYYVEENPKYVERVEAIITAVEAAPIEVVSSVITLTEVLTHPYTPGADPLRAGIPGHPAAQQRFSAAAGDRVNS